MTYQSVTNKLEIWVREGGGEIARREKFALVSFKIGREISR